MERLARSVGSKINQYFKRLDEYLTSALWGKPEEVKIISVDFKNPYIKTEKWFAVSGHGGAVSAGMQKVKILPYRVTFEDKDGNRIVGTKSFRDYLQIRRNPKYLEERKNELKSLIGKTVVIRRKDEIRLYYLDYEWVFLDEDPEGTIFESLKGDENG
jgi:hypothetical protein